MTPRETYLTAHRRLWHNASAGAIQAVLSGIILFFLLRVLIERLGMDQIGIWALLMAWLSLGRMADMGMSGAIVRLGASLIAANKIRDAYRTIWLGSLLSSILTAALIVIISGIIWLFFHKLIQSQSSPSTFIILSGIISWLSSVLVSLRAGLDAMSRVDLRQMSSLFQNTLLLVSVYVIVKNNELQTLLSAQVAASLGSIVFVLITYFSARIKPQGKEEKVSKVNQILRGLISYGLPFQVSTIAGLLLEPLIKLLLGIYSTLAVIACYELSSRIINQARSVLVSAAEALIPHAAILSVENNAEELTKSHSNYCKLNVMMSTLGFSLLITGMPTISWLWFGYHYDEFLLCGCVLGYSAWLSVMAVPAYFFAQGMGVQRWNVFAHMTILGVSLLLGIALGYLGAATGVLMSYVIAIVLGNGLVLYGNKKTMLSNQSNQVWRKVMSVPWTMTLFPIIAMVPTVYALNAQRTHQGSLGMSLSVSIIIMIMILTHREFLENVRKITKKIAVKIEGKTT
jgi:O-antigen/teichoic acid export membrane protein